MAKAGFSKETTSKGGLNFEEGWGEIVEIASMIHQFPPNQKTKEQSDPGIFVRCMLQRTDADGNHTGEDPVEQFFSCGDMEEFHPGMADNASDDEPSDEGDTVGKSEGNCIFSVNGKKISQNSKWIRFTNSAEDKNFDATVSANGFLPDWIGLKGFFTTIKLPKGKNWKGGEKDPEALVVDKITQFPYDKKSSKKGNKGAAAGSAPAAPAGTGSSKKGAAPKGGSNKSGDGDEVDAEIASITVDMLKAIAKANPGAAFDVAKLGNKAVFALGKAGVPPAQHKFVQAAIKNAAWLATACKELDYAYDEAEGVVFPAA